MNIKLKLFLFSILISVSSLSFAVDTDHDGLPDDWELANGRDPLVADYQISSDSNVVCVLDENDVKCWGSNWSGHLNVPQLQNPKHVSVGVTHACAIDFSGVSCWGNNWAGQTDVPNLVNPTLVEAGNGNTCALDDSGIVCWGWNDSGQSVVPNLVNPRHISVGKQHACALDDNGVACWGEDWAIPPELLNPTAISSGGYKTCAIDDTGVVCWGRSQFSYGALDVPDLSNPTSVVAGHAQNVCAFDDSGIVCWGRKDSAFLTDFPELKDPSMLCKTFRCALTGEGVITWFDEFTMGSSIPKLVFDADEDGYSSQREDSFNNREQDLYPLDGNEWFDTDTDGIGNNTDADDDGDGVADTADAFPLDSTETVDTDLDGIGNNADTDDDGDGVSDSSDVWPLDNRYSLDSDSDGMPDAFEDANGLNKYIASDAGSDSDEDGLTALQEFDYGTSPTTKDSDFDNLPDGWEIENGRNPILSDYPVATSYSHAILTDDGPKYLGDLSEGRIFLVPELIAPFAIAMNDQKAGSVSSTAGGVALTGIRTCVLDQKEAKCWSQSYDRNPDDSIYQTLTLETAKPFTNPSEIAISTETACVVDGHKVSCWTKEDRSSPIDGTFYLKNPRSLLVTNHSACAISDDGVYCWGHEVYETDTWRHRLESPQLQMIEGLGGTHYNGVGPSCGLDQQGIFCWPNQDGVWDYGLGNVPNLINPFSLSMSHSRACSLSESGLTCWGASGDTIDALADQLVNPKEVFTGKYHTCVWDGRGLVCNGYDGQVTRPQILIDPDGDGFTSQDGIDAFPLDASEWLDTDLDGVGNNADPDDDNDSVLDTDDVFPLNASESADTDGDGIGNNADAFPNDPSETIDSDQDGIGDNSDNCISIANTDQLNSDDDLLGNACDEDDDNDGISDEFDALPLDASEQLDTDADGIGNTADNDDDDDGVADDSDAYPLNNLYSADSDGDGMADTWELLYGLDPNDPSDASSDTDYDGAVALQEFIEGTIPSGSLDIDGNGQYDALTDGLLLLRGMFLLSGDPLISDAVASDAVYKTSDEIASRISILGDLIDIDGNGSVDALTDGLVILRYLFNLRGDVLINDVIASDATVKTAEDVEAKIEQLIPSL